MFLVEIFEHFCLEFECLWGFYTYESKFEWAVKFSEFDSLLLWTKAIFFSLSAILFGCFLFLVYSWLKILDFEYLYEFCTTESNFELIMYFFSVWITVADDHYLLVYQCEFFFFWLIRFEFLNLALEIPAKKKKKKKKNGKKIHCEMEKWCLKRI